MADEEAKEVRIFRVVLRGIQAPMLVTTTSPLLYMWKMRPDGDDPLTADDDVAIRRKDIMAILDCTAAELMRQEMVGAR